MAYIDDAEVLVVVKKYVEPGQELTIAYVDTGLTTAERREELREVYGFDCRCAKCAPPPTTAGNGAKMTKRNVAAAASRKRKTAGDDAGNRNAGKKAKKGEGGKGCVIC